MTMKVQALLLILITYNKRNNSKLLKVQEKGIYLKSQKVLRCLDVPYVIENIVI